jgi:iron complex transport system substrate-binding protein
MQGPRIVSLIASATEIVCALGLEDHLVGRSHECDYPESVKCLPACTAPKFNTDGTSYEIDQRVKAILQEGLAVYRVNAALLQEIQPEVIVTQTQCEVCAVSLRDVEEATCQWLGSRPKIVSLHPNGLSDVWQDIRLVAEAVAVPQRGLALVDFLQSRIKDIAAAAQAQAERPTVACIEWIDPLMAAGNWVPELVALAGGVNLFGEAGKHSPWMTWEELRKKDPDFILIMPCGYDIERSRQEIGGLAAQPGWRSLRAVQNRHVYLTDGNQFFNRPGPRIVESLEIMAEILQPRAFSFGHEGRGWVRLPWD